MLVVVFADYNDDDQTTDHGSALAVGLSMEEGGGSGQNGAVGPSTAMGLSTVVGRGGRRRVLTE